jgi:hypothetical protein
MRLSSAVRLPIIDLRRAFAPDIEIYFGPSLGGVISRLAPDFRYSCFRSALPEPGGEAASWQLKERIRLRVCMQMMFRRGFLQTVALNLRSSSPYSDGEQLD